jgi:hypothetical protein
MPQLPKAIEDLIWHYLGTFYVAMSLPSKRGVKRLVKKTNLDILQRYLVVKLAQSHTTSHLAKVLIQDIPRLLENFTELQTVLDAVVSSIKFCPSTSCLRWIFLDHELWKNEEYFDIFRTSVLFHLMCKTDLEI